MYSETVNFSLFYKVTRLAWTEQQYQEQVTAFEIICFYEQIKMGSEHHLLQP